jgi:hypothetical protein
MRQEKEEDTTEKRLLPGLFAKKAERNVNFWTSSEASQPIKLILHQNGYRWRTLGKVETKPYAQCTGTVCAEKTLHLAQPIEEAHPVERELQSEKRA